MKILRAYRNPDCVRCARFARVAHFFDWFDRVDFSTRIPPSGPLQLGEVVVEDIATGHIYHGVDGIELLWRHLPAYAPLRPLLKIPALRARIDREVRPASAH